MNIITALLFSLIPLVGLLVGVIFYFKRKNDELKDLTNTLRSNSRDWNVYSSQVVSDATTKANDIVTQAEVESLKIASENSMETTLFQEQFQRKLDQIVLDINQSMIIKLDEMGKKFEANLDSGQKKYEEFLTQLEKQTISLQSTTEEEMRSKVSDILNDFEGKMSDFFSRAEKQSLDTLNLEIQSARELINSYKSQQLQIVDENIIAILEQTIALVLKQKLSLKEQIDLVFDSLEKAKSDKFLI